MNRQPLLTSRGLLLAFVLFAVAFTVVLVRDNRRIAENDDHIGELACQVEQLGGRPVGDARCPPKPTPRATSRTGDPGLPPGVVVVPVPGSTVTSPVPGRTRTVTAKPSRSASPAPSRSARPSPSPTCRPVPILNRCLR